ncbi:MAG TPA: hypothetical protein ENK89_04430 [Desulfobulbaceae bacterium]|nr:hypothetical protein [Desulfobulbaceae bacterium]
MATTDEKVTRFRDRIAELHNSGDFYDWRHVAAFGRELERLLDDVAESVKDCRTGVELMSLFFESDGVIFESCDDSGGEIGAIFQDNAAGIFAEFAAGCSDKQWIRNRLVKLLGEDGYGVRDSLLDHVGNYLPEEEIRLLIEQFSDRAAKETSTYQRRNWYRNIEQLAEGISDAQLFEATRINSLGKPNARACLDIGRVYLQSGDPKTAQAWLERIDEKNFILESKRDELLRSIYSQLGDTDKLEETAWKQFRGYRCLDGLEELLEVIGRDQRKTVILQQGKEILRETKFNSSDAAFLLATDQVDAAEKYLLQHAEQLDGDMYFDLLPLAEAMEEEGRYLVAIMVYRSLLDSILRRGYTRSYHHGVDYLEKLDILSLKINDWRRFSTHEQYKQDLHKTHGRKYSFWEKYNG